MSETDDRRKDAHSRTDAHLQPPLLTRRTLLGAGLGAAGSASPLPARGTRWSVTRALAMIWGSQVSMVDVASGAVTGPYELGYKGDFLTLSTGVDTLAQAVSTRMIADAARRAAARGNRRAAAETRAARSGRGHRRAVRRLG